MSRLYMTELHRYYNSLITMATKHLKISRKINESTGSKKGEAEYTEIVNLKRAEFELVPEWVNAMWKKFTTKDLIVKDF